eukprot:560139-Pelagomonas_calceolata.AAC.4
MAKQERMWPCSRGSNQRCCCSRLAYLASTSMFPVSGAPQLKTSGAQTLLRTTQGGGGRRGGVRSAQAPLREGVWVGEGAEEGVRGCEEGLDGEGATPWHDHPWKSSEMPGEGLLRAAH